MKLIITSLIFIFATIPAHALKVVAVKNGRVLIELEGESISAGDRLGARDSSGKARAILEVKQVKGNKILAQVVKGKMEASYAASKIGGASGGSSQAATSTRSSKSATSPQSESDWGFLGGFSSNSMTVKPSANSSVSLSGTSFAVSGFYQMKIDGNFSARIIGGYESLTATGTADTAICAGTTSCEVDIGYLGMEGLARYSFWRSPSMEIWVGGGLGFLFAMSKSSNLLDTSKITTNQTIVGALGLDYRLSKDTFVPVQFDYAVYPDNNTSSATQMILRIGYGMSF